MPTINRKINSIKKVEYKHDDNSALFYNSKGWHILRNAYYQAHPLCEMCLSNGITRQAEHVHHIKPFLNGKTDKERWELLLNPNNLMSLCVDCHHKIHKKLPKIADFY